MKDKLKKLEAIDELWEYRAPLAETEAHVDWLILELRAAWKENVSLKDQLAWSIRNEEKYKKRLQKE